MKDQSTVMRRCILSLCVALLLLLQQSVAQTTGRRTPMPSRTLSAEMDASSLASLRGGRGPEHCALSIGIFLGGALGFWVNPFLGTQAMRFGLMASVLNCS
jgi:hypothetical protein